MTKKKNGEISLSAALVKKLIKSLSKAQNNHRLSVKDKHYIKRSLDLMEEEVRKTPNNTIKLNNKLIREILISLTFFLSDKRVVDMLLDLFFGNKK